MAPRSEKRLMLLTLFDFDRESVVSPVDDGSAPGAAREEVIVVDETALVVRADCADAASLTPETIRPEMTPYCKVGLGDEDARATRS
jgi:hypothetical protein